MFSSAAVADQWMPATKQVYESPDHLTRLTVVPRDLDSPLAYFQDKVAGHEPAGAAAGSKMTSAIATLETRDTSGRWAKAWTKSLSNEVAPVDVLVANGGRNVVTFDNWHSMGYGPNAIAVYDGQGAMLSAFGLEELFPKWFVAAQPHSVSSIWWRGHPRISDDGSSAIIPIRLPNENQSLATDGPTLDLFVSLLDGKPVGLTDQPWNAALAKAASTAREMCRAQRDQITEWNSPISIPTKWVEPVWHQYLREIVYRSGPTLTEDETPAVATTVLRPPSERDFQPSVQWLKEALTDKADIPDFEVRAIGSPDYERLTKEIETISPKISTGRLRGVQLVIVVDEVRAVRVRAALSRSGAKVRIVSPSETFPQRPEKMQKIDTAALPVCQVPQA
jgi:hypothetical protein